MNQTTKTINGKTYEVCLFPMEYINITQKDHVGTHIASYALDCMGKDVNKDLAYRHVL